MIVEVPTGWESEKLENLSINGITNGTFNDPKLVGSGYRHINVDQMYVGSTIDLENLSRLNIDKKTFEKKKVNYGDVFFTRSSLVLEGIAKCNVNLSDADDLTFDDHLMRVRPDQERVDPFFLAEYCRTDFARRFFMRHAKRSTMTTIGQRDIGPLPVLLPPLSEQKKISEILSAWDRATSNTRALLQQKQNRYKGLMSRLFTTDPSKSLTPMKEVRLADVCSQIIDGTHFTPSYTPVGVPFISVENITKNDFVNTKFISEEEHKKISKRCSVTRGDILMTRIGSLGNTKMVDWDHECSIYVSLALIRAKKPENAFYIYEFTKSNMFKKEVWKRSLTNASPMKINLKDIGSIHILMPASSADQDKIVKILSVIRNEITLLREQEYLLNVQKRGLMQQLLTGKTRVKV